MPKTKLKRGVAVRSNRIVLRRVYRGWISPNMPEELPKKVDDRTEIVFGSYKWHDDDRRCRITVEIYGKPQNATDETRER